MMLTVQEMIITKIVLNLATGALTIERDWKRQPNYKFEEKGHLILGHTLVSIGNMW